MHGSCKIALYMVLLSDADNNILNSFWLLFAMLKMRDHRCLHSYALFYGK